LRQFGLKPKRPAAYPSKNFAKSIAIRAVRKVRSGVKSLTGKALGD
jgi:hypothetical protein